MIKYLKSIGIGVGILLIVSFVIMDHWPKVIKQRDIITLKVALFSGNSWGIPQRDAYAIYDFAAELFQEQYKAENINIEFTGGRMIQDYSEWLASQVIQGKEADVFLVLEEDLSSYADIGLLENLSTYLKASSTFPERDFYETALKTGEFKDKQYALAFQVVPTFLVVNKTLLEANQIEINEAHWTWEEFYRICNQITQDTDQDGKIDQYGVVDYDWEKAFYTHDTKLFSENGKIVAFDSFKLTETVDFMKKHYILNQGTVVQESWFDKGKVAFKTFTLPEYRAYGTYPYRILKYENFQWEALPYPYHENGQSVSKLYTTQLAMSSRSKQKEWAYKFIEFMARDERVQKAVWDQTYSLPVLKSVVKIKLAEEAATNIPYRVLDSEFLDTIIENSYYDPVFKYYKNLKNIMDSRILQIIAQDKVVAEEISLLRKELEKEIKKNAA